MLDLVMRLHLAHEELVGVIQGRLYGGVIKPGVTPFCYLPQQDRTFRRPELKLQPE